MSLEMAVARPADQLLKDLLAHNYDGSPLAAPVFISLYRAAWKPAKLLEAVIAVYNDTLSLKATREACVNLTLHWIEARLIPDFCRAKRSKTKKSSKAKTLSRLVEFADSLERRSHNYRDFSSCYAIKLAVLRSWSQRRRTGYVHIGPQQRIELAVENNENGASQKAKETDKERSAGDKEAKRSFLVFIWVPDPRNVAMRFTLFELSMFRKLAHRELLGLTWRDKTAPHPAYNILELIARSNNVSFWVASRVVKRKTVEKRVDMITKWIDIAYACAELHNYNTLMEILGGLNSHPVSRLKKTWDKLPQGPRETFKVLETLMESKGNYRNYRTKLQDLRAGGQFFLPYLGVYLRDMVTLDEAMPTKRDHGINIEKFNVILSVLSEIDYVLHLEPRAVIKRASGVMRGLQDDVNDADEGLAFISHVHGFSEGELLRLSKLAEPPRTLPTDADLVHDESVGSLSATSSHDDSSLHAVDSGPIAKSSSSVLLPGSASNGSKSDKTSLGGGPVSPNRGMRASGPLPSPTQRAKQLADTSSRSSNTGSDKST